MNEQLSFGQRIDESLGILEPWLTNPAMDVIKTWWLADKVVLEYGGGSSSIWWAAKAKKCYTIEANKQWYEDILKEKEQRYITNLDVILREVNEGDQTKVDYYTEVPKGCKPNIVLVDGILRYECILKALILPRPLTLIVDNWNQDYVFICPAAEKALEGQELLIFPQPNHENHEGNCWKTLIVHLK